MKPDTSYGDILLELRKTGNKNCGTLPKEDICNVEKKKDFSRRSGKMKHLFSKCRDT